MLDERNNANDTAADFIQLISGSKFYCDIYKMYIQSIQNALFAELFLHFILQ